MAKLENEVYRVRFRSAFDRQMIKGFKYQNYELKLELTSNSDEALTLITNKTDQQEIALDLYQAFTRSPVHDSKPIPYGEAIATYDLIQQNFELWITPCESEIGELINVTYGVDGVMIEIDQFGAERQIGKEDNWFFDVNNLTEDQTASVLSMGHYVDDVTGSLYPGMTTMWGDQTRFWRLPDGCFEWVTHLNNDEILPCKLTFARQENGTVNVIAKSIHDPDL